MRREARGGLYVLAAFAVAVAVGTAGYMLIEGWSLLDAVYMTITTIFTVGFGEVHPMSTAGEVFTLVLIVGGVGVIFYGIGVMAEFIIGEQLKGLFRGRAVRRRVERLDGHHIICGYGRVGEAIARQFASHKASFVVIDNDPEALERAHQAGWLAVAGDATSDEVLEAAGIRKAAGLVAALGSDASNIFVSLSARVLNPRLLIVARASSDDTVSKLRRAGADHVVTPYGIGGKRMATLLLKPLVSDYIEVVTGGGELEFVVEELGLEPGCCGVGRSIRDLDVRNQTGATILAVRRAESGEFETNPSPGLMLQPNDRIIAIGTKDEIGRLETLLRAPTDLASERE
jgi:voltage-gated potassium channel